MIIITIIYTHMDVMNRIIVDFARQILLGVISHQLVCAARRKLVGLNHTRVIKTY